MDSPSQRLRLLIVSHAYAAIENRKKIQALGLLADVVCVTSEISQEEILGQSASAFDSDDDAPDRSYRLVRLPRVGASITRFYYRGLGAVMRDSGAFDAVLVENEPWAVVLWQAWWQSRRSQPQAVFGEFTWENVTRPGLRGLILSTVYRFAALVLDFVIGGNRAAVNLFRCYGLDEDASVVSPQLGVDTVSHSPVSIEEKKALRRQNGLPADGVLLGYCGRFVEEKGLRELINACVALRERGSPVNLVLLGAGSLLSEFQMRQQTAPWLHLLPPRPHTGIPSFLQMLDVFVLGSKPVRADGECWEEQFGHVLIEAMACGVVTLGANSGAIPEVIGEERFVFQWGDVDGLEKILRPLVGDAELRESTSASQRQRICELYTHEAVAGQWLAFIRNRILAMSGHIARRRSEAVSV
ncbi:MAG: glycosyltransferase family 4 protein [Verrucomicrobiales bacterium]|nr:glycosyltransferase family 4 protein [Verrucomicrobiales bacterium]MCP5560030.1 glycosyltransferase family 4 protein [Verrucomicrobiaceae bacterium]